MFRRQPPTVNDPNENDDLHLPVIPRRPGGNTRRESQSIIQCENRLRQAWKPAIHGQTNARWVHKCLWSEHTQMIEYRNTTERDSSRVPVGLTTEDFLSKVKNSLALSRRRYLGGDILGEKLHQLVTGRPGAVLDQENPEFAEEGNDSTDEGGEDLTDARDTDTFSMADTLAPDQSLSIVAPTAFTATHPLDRLFLAVSFRNREATVCALNDIGADADTDTSRGLHRLLSLEDRLIGTKNKRPTLFTRANFFGELPASDSGCSNPYSIPIDARYSQTCPKCDNPNSQLDHFAHLMMPREDLSTIGGRSYTGWADEENRDFENRAQVWDALQSARRDGKPYERPLSAGPLSMLPFVNAPHVRYMPKKEFRSAGSNGVE